MGEESVRQPGTQLLQVVFRVSHLVAVHSRALSLGDTIYHPSLKAVWGKRRLRPLSV